MDNKQVIKQLEDFKKGYVECDKYLKQMNLEAIDKAIESLEAWDKVKEAIEKEIKFYKHKSYTDKVVVNKVALNKIKEAKVNSYQHTLEIINTFIKEESD